MRVRSSTNGSWVLPAMLMAATSAQAAPVVTEIMYNPPGSSEANFEWFEIYNPGPGALDISGMIVVTGSTTTPKQGAVPAATPAIPVGGFAVLAKLADLGVACAVNGAQVAVAGEFGLNNSTARVAVFAAGATDLSDGNALDVVLYRSAGFADSTDGVSLRLHDLAVDNYIGSNWSPSQGASSGCEPYRVGTTGALYGTPGRPNDWCYRAGGEDAGVAEDAGGEDAGAGLDAGTSSSEPVCLSGGFDAGVVDSAVLADGSVGVDADQGDVPVLDAGSIDLGPQNPPTIALSQPATPATASPSVDIAWAASDPDDDALAVGLFYAADDSATDGVLIVDSLPAQGTYTWTPVDVPAATYRVFGRATDARGGLAYAFAAGSVTVPPAAVPLPQLTIVTPTGSEGEVREPVEIAFSHNDLPGTIDLFYDVDSSGHDGQPIIGGIAVPGGPTRVQWNIDEVPAGTYFVHGRYQAAGGVATAYSPGSVTVIHDAEGCGCRAAVAPGGAATILAALACFLLRRRRQTTWR